MMFGRNGAESRIIGVLGAFFDDSGTHAKASLVVIGGLLGSDVQWDKFAVAWDARLAAPLPGMPPLSHFHLSECRAGDGQFDKYKQAEKDRITYLFRQIIFASGLVSVACAFDLIAWKEIVGKRKYIQDALPSPLEMCLAKCIDLVVAYARANKNGEQVIVFVDQGTRKRLESWVKVYKLQAEQYPELVSVIFAPVPRVVALQGADMIATESYQYGVKWLQHGAKTIANPHFQEYLQRDLSVGLVFGREQITEAVGLLKKKLRKSM